MKQGGAPPTGKWAGSPLGGVKAPDPIILPNKATRFARTADRLEDLSAGHPMADWLNFMAALSRAQQTAAATLKDLANSDGLTIEVAVAERRPPLAVAQHRRDPAWRDGLAALLDAMDLSRLPAEASIPLNRLRNGDAGAIETLADSLLEGSVSADNAASALFVAAALQVYFTHLAASLDASALRLLEERGICPCCGSTPVAGVVTVTGAAPGTRYLHCSLCSTAWVHTRAVCITCGDSRTLAVKGIDGDSGLVRAETCNACQTYSKLLYQAKDTHVDAFADDLASLGLDIMVAEAGWSRHAPNPLLLVG